MDQVALLPSLLYVPVCIILLGALRIARAMLIQKGDVSRVLSLSAPMKWITDRYNVAMARVRLVILHCVVGTINKHLLYYHLAALIR